MPTLLLEIGCEELPASACHEAALQLPELCRRHVGADPSSLYVGPRRLALAVAELPERAADELRRGPAERIAFDEEGRPTKAGEGFARGQGLRVEELERREGHVWAHLPGRPLAETLPERLGELVRGIAFGKSMRWNESGFAFARPMRWLCALLDAETVAFEVAGVPSGRRSYGHRFSAGSVEIPHAREYAEVLRGAGVEPDSSERHRAIVEGLDALGEWTDPQGVLREVVHLVERPLVLDGAFDERFLRLPRRVVVTAMQAHQRYFPLGANRFGFVANGGDPGTVRAGNERVLEGRLDDATFTFERDVALGIDGLLERLGSITFLAGAGSYADKTERLVELVQALGGGDEAVAAARIAKADQAAELVREFPELEGHIGAEYARLEGRPEGVCAAVEEHHLPDASGGPLPESGTGRLLAAADRIDTLNVAFGLRRRPTGSRDPYGLRRAAIGLCRLALEGGVRVPVELLEGEVADFVEERYEGLLDVPVEFVRAARGAPVRDLAGVARLAQALAGLDDEELDSIHTAYVRSSRLAEPADGAGELDASLLIEPAEVEVARAVEAVRPRVRTALEQGELAAAVAAAAALGPPLERFFKDVLVMAEDERVRGNRLRLLAEVRDTIGLLGDLSQIPR